MLSILKSASKIAKFILPICRLQSNTARPFIKRDSQNLLNKNERNFQGEYEMARNLDKESLQKLGDKKLSYLLLSAFRENDLEVACKVFQAINTPSEKSFTQYVSLLKKHNLSTDKISPTIHTELTGIWRKIVACRCEGDSILLNSLFGALSYSKEEQKKLICEVISKPARETYSCGVLSCFLKFLISCNDQESAREVWKWGESIRKREFGSHFYFSTSFQYLNLFGASVEELKSLWNQITEHGLHEKKELVTSMCSSLSIDVNVQKEFISMIISSPPNPSFNSGLLCVFMKLCCNTNDKELAKRVWEWGKSIRKRDFRSFVYFSTSFQYLNLFGASVEELKSLWNEITQQDLHRNEDLVNSMCCLLSIDRNEQKKFISMIISSPPNHSFHSGLLGGFMKHCCDTNDKELAKRVWEWGKSIRKRDFGSDFYFSTSFQYLNFFGASVEELKSLWNQITEHGLHGQIVLVTSMCSLLSIDPDEQMKFISMIISSPPDHSFTCNLLGCFLVPCSIHSNIPLAQSIWSWGLSIREKEKGSPYLCTVTIQYLGICSKTGDNDLIESVWSEADAFGVTYLMKVKWAYLSALAANAVFERVVKGIDQVGIDSVDDHILTIILKAFGDAGEAERALVLLRRFQKENPSVVSIIPYNVVIDALCLKGKFDVALSIVEEAKSYGYEADAVTWLSILFSSKKFKNLPIAVNAFDAIKSMNSDQHRLATAYSMMADVYRSCGEESKAKEIEEERLSKGVRFSRQRVNLYHERSSISFFLDEIPDSLGPEISDKINQQLKKWVPLLESRGISTEPITSRNAEMLALAYAVAVLDLKEVAMRKDFRISVESHEANRVLSSILGIKIRHWDLISNKELARLHVMIDGKCSCRGSAII